MSWQVSMRRYRIHMTLYLKYRDFLHLDKHHHMALMASYEHYESS